jgi:ABC-type lipoprotein export system ATPase subunit
MVEPLVRAVALSKRYGDKDSGVMSLLDSTFEITPTAHIAIMGPSGSGKSTLLQLISGLVEATSGQLDWPASKGKNELRPGYIGISFQGPSLMAPLTVLENVALPLLVLGTVEETANLHAARMLARFDLEDVCDKLPEEISGGQAQRAGLARALVAKPLLVLADEPTGQQDRAGGKHVVDTILSATKESGAALVIATHDGEVADRLDHCWSLIDGLLTQ